MEIIEHLKNQDNIGETIGLFILVVGYLLKELYTHLKVRPDNKKAKSNLDVVLKGVTDSQKENTARILKIEKFTAIAANQYTTTLPDSMMEHVVKLMFNSSRCKINATIVDWIRGEDLNNPRVMTLRKTQIIDMIINIYDNDFEFLDHFGLAHLMDILWVAKVTDTCIQFIEAHSQTGNHFKELQRNLKNDFIKIENEFFKKMRG